MNDKPKTIISLALLAAVFLSFFAFLLPNLPLKEQTVEQSKQIILTMWHVETFEGGTGDRGEWLKKRAYVFQKSHKGVYIDVCKTDYRQFKNRLKEGQGFDLIGFGGGVGLDVLNLLVPLRQAKDIPDDLLCGGKVDGKIYALPYCTGCYITAIRQSDARQVNGFKGLPSDLYNCALDKKTGKTTRKLASVATGFGSFNNPLAALSLNTDQNAKSGDVCCDFDTTQYEAYTSFLRGDKATVLLGTQRDYFRLDNRQKSGNIGEIIFNALGGFNDLTQYVAVGQNADAEREKLATSFAEFLLSDASQAALTSVGMLPTTKNAKVPDGFVAEMYAAALKSKTISAFASQEVLNGFKTAAKKAIFDGNKSDVKKYLL